MHTHNGSALDESYGFKAHVENKPRNLPETIDSNKGGHDCRIYRTTTIGFNWEGTNCRPIMKHNSAQDW